MKRVLESKKISPETVGAIGVAIHERGGHIGLIYRLTDNDPVRLLDLGWHNTLRSEFVSPAYVCWVRPGIPSERADAVASLCRRIWKKNRDGKVPYGLTRPGRFFDTAGGQLKAPATVGLTCASFVLEVFDVAGLPLILYDTWPLPDAEDIRAQKEYYDRLEADPKVDRAHVKAYASEIGNNRYRPLQVAGACAADNHPVTHAVATELAAKIDKLLVEIRAALHSQE